MSGMETACLLLIEDNPADAGLVGEALEEHSVICKVVVLNNGEKALDFIHGVEAGLESCPDLVILDLNLPRVPGAEVLSRIRKGPLCASIPVIILTSSDNRRDQEEAARLGASRYFQKPSNLDDFLKLGGVVEEMLRGKLKPV